MPETEHLTILIIEDEPDTLFFYGRALEREGFKVILSKDSDSGISEAKHKIPDVIILDLKLPPEETPEAGFRVFQELSKDSTTRAIPVIVVTAYSSEENKTRATHLGANNYLEKPVTDDELIKAVKEAVLINSTI